MLYSVFLSILTMSVVNIDCKVPIGRIYNATYISIVTSMVITYKNTCDECLCYGFFSTESPLYVGLNCYAKNKTCHLFANYSSLSAMEIDFNSTFIFVQLPQLPDVTTGNGISLSISNFINLYSLTQF
jgi:hypothetical protein